MQIVDGSRRVGTKTENVLIRVTPEFKQRIESVSGKEGISEFVRRAVEDRLSGADNQVRDLKSIQISDAIGSVLKEVEEYTAELRGRLQQLASPPVLMCYTCGDSYQITREHADSILRSGGKGPQCSGCHDDDMTVREPKAIPASVKRLIQGVRGPAVLLEESGQ